MPRRHIPQSMRRRIVRIVRDGATVADAARELGVFPAVAYETCRAAGLRFGPGGNVGALASSAARHRAMDEVARKGEPAAVIGARFGFSEMPVRYACGKHGR